MSWSKEIIQIDKLSVPDKTRMKIRYSSEEYQEDVKSTSKGRKPKVVSNKYCDYFADFSNRSLDDLDPRVENVLVGVCRLNWYRKSGKQLPLSLRKLVYVLGKFDEITADKISWLLDVGERQSQRYLKACGLALEFIDRDKIAVNAIVNDRLDECELDDYLLL